MLKGAVPVVRKQKGKPRTLTALLAGGSEIPLLEVKEVTKDQPQKGLVCPMCQNSILDNEGVYGPNKAIKFSCPGCETTWRSGEDLMSGVGIVIE